MATFRCTLHNMRKLTSTGKITVAVKGLQRCRTPSTIEINCGAEVRVRKGRADLDFDVEVCEMAPTSLEPYGLIPFGPASM